MNAKRFKMVVQEIVKLSKMRNEISDYYKKNLNNLIYNHNIIKNNRSEDIFREYILNI